MDVGEELFEFGRVVFVADLGDEGEDGGAVEVGGEGEGGAGGEGGEGVREGGFGVQHAGVDNIMGRGRIIIY